MKFFQFLLKITAITLLISGCAPTKLLLNREMRKCVTDAYKSQKAYYQGDYDSSHVLNQNVTRRAEVLMRDGYQHPWLLEGATMIKLGDIMVNLQFGQFSESLDSLESLSQSFYMDSLSSISEEHFLITYIRFLKATTFLEIGELTLARSLLDSLAHSIKIYNNLGWEYVPGAKLIRARFKSIKNGEWLLPFSYNQKGIVSIYQQEPDTVLAYLYGGLNFLHEKYPKIIPETEGIDFVRLVPKPIPDPSFWNSAGISVIGPKLYEKKTAVTVSFVAAQLHNNLAYVACLMEDEDLGLRHLDFVRQYIQRNQDKGESAVWKRLNGRYFFVMGEALLRKKKWKEARGAYEEAIQAWKSLYLRGHPHIATCYRRIARTYRGQGMIDPALENYQRGIGMLVKARDKQLLHLQTPNSYEMFLLPEAIELLADKGNILMEIYPTEPEMLRRSLRAYMAAIGIIEQLPKTYREDASKIKMRASYYYVFEESLAAAYQLYKLTQDEAFLDTALQISEKGKAALLRESLQGLQASTLAGGDTALIRLLELRKSLRLEIDGQQNRLFSIETSENKKDNSTQNKQDFVNRQIIQAQIRLDDVVDQIRQNYRAYSAYVQDLGESISLASVQASINSDSLAIIEFFYGQEHVYAFGITKQTAHLYRLKTAEIDASIDSLHLIWSIGPDHLLGKTKSDSTRVVIEPFIPNQQDLTGDELIYHLYKLSNRCGFYLYTRVLDPLLIETGTEKINELLIIPDGKLSYISFEALLTKLPDKSQYSEIYRRYDLPFLIKDYAIGYDYFSKSDQGTMESRGERRSLYGGFAPRYGKPGELNNTVIYRGEGDGNNFEPLRFNGLEIDTVANLLGAPHEAYSDSAFTTKSYFESKATDYRILHLATHGETNDQFPNNSALIFTRGDSTVNQRLHAYEIFHLDLGAELVLLTGCSTGKGKLSRGEGAESIARAFHVANSPSVMMTLWPIPDVKANSELMWSFFNQLKRGQRKSQALRYAKLHYIEEHAEIAYPHIWAPFIISGSQVPITLID